MLEEFDVSNLVLNHSAIDLWYKDNYQKLADKYCQGDISLVRKTVPDKASWLSEFHRAMACLIISGFDDIKKYSILPSVYKDIVTAFSGTYAKNIVSKAEKSRRSSKQQHAVQYCKENAGKQIKVKQFAEAVQWSYPTANKFVQDRLDLFTKVSRGIYLMRNPDVERAIEKNAAKNKE